MTNDERKFWYALGARDMLAKVLAETKDEVRLIEQALFYKMNYGEEHFSHKWHTSASKDMAEAGDSANASQKPS